MPDLTALHEARAALDQHLSRLSSEAPRRRRRRRTSRRRAAILGGVIAVLLAAAAFLPLTPMGGGSASMPVDATPRPSVGGASLALATPVGWKGDKAVVVHTAGPREVLRRSADDAPPPRAVPAPPIKVAGLLQPNPPGRYDFEQESAVTGTINPPTPAARPMAAGGKTLETGKTADAGAAADPQARPADPSTPPSKAVGTRRRAKAARQTTPVVVQRVGSGVAKLFAWVMPTRSSR